MAKRREKTLRQLMEQKQRLDDEFEIRQYSNLGPVTSKRYDPNTQRARMNQAETAYDKYFGRIAKHFLGKDHPLYYGKKELEPFLDIPVSSRIYLGLGAG